MTDWSALKHETALVLADFLCVFACTSCVCVCVCVFTDIQTYNSEPLCRKKGEHPICCLSMYLHTFPGGCDVGILTLVSCVELPENPVTAFT